MLMRDSFFYIALPRSHGGWGNDEDHGKRIMYVVLFLLLLGGGGSGGG